MKTTIATIALCLGFTLGNAQSVKEAAVPATVKDAFAKKYPATKVKEWEKEEDGYEAEFMLNKVESSATFSNDGTFKELEQEIKVTALPKAATEYCTKNFSGYKLSEASKITNADGKMTFEAELEKDKMKFDAFFDEKGSFIKKSEPAKESKEDKD